MGDAGADLYVDLGVSGEEGKGVRLRYGSGQPFQLSWGAGERGAQRLLKSSFFLLQSICGARLLLRFWWALSLAMAREMLKSRMGSEEEVDEGAVESCFLGLSWEFSCKRGRGGTERESAPSEASGPSVSARWLPWGSAQGSQVTRTERDSACDLQGQLVCQE